MTDFAKKQHHQPEELTLDQLAAETGYTARTVRYYIQQGLLPSPGHGANARYDAGHRDRLLLIRKLQRERFSLNEIREKFETLDDEAIQAALARTPEAPAVTPEPKPDETVRSQWERIQVGPNLELQVRRPLSRQDNKRVEQLIEYARKLYLTEDT